MFTFVGGKGLDHLHGLLDLWDLGDDALMTSEELTLSEAVAIVGFIEVG